MKTKSTIKQHLKEMISSLFPHIKRKSDHVILSDYAERILKDKSLATKVVKAIMDNKSNLLHGQEIPIEGEEIAIGFKTNIIDSTKELDKK